MSLTFEQAHALYLKNGPPHSPHTLAAYDRAIRLFLDYLDDPHYEPQLDIQKGRQVAQSRQSPLENLTDGDEGLLLHFARWLAQSRPKGGAPYSQATRELRLTAVLKWLEFLAGRGLFPPAFSWAGAIAQLKAEQARPVVPRAEKAAHLTQDLGPLLSFYAQQTPGPKLAKSPTALARWQLARLRNQALLETLAESAGQVSAILGLDVADIGPENAGPLRLAIQGKGEHPYELVLDQSLGAVWRYLQQRGPLPADKPSPLFISHDPHHQGQRMSRIVAWRIVQRAAGGVGLGEVSPHDLRHWRAKQLIEAGATLEELKIRLGHRSNYTVKVYYGHWLAERDSNKEGGD
jgi:site-specific recombinase XerD